MDATLPRAQAFVAFVVNLAFFILYVATANYTRLLLDELRKLGMDATNNTRRQSNANTATARADFVFALPGGFDDTDAAPLLCGGVIVVAAHSKGWQDHDWTRAALPCLCQWGPKCLHEL